MSDVKDTKDVNKMEPPVYEVSTYIAKPSSDLEAVHKELNEFLKEETLLARDILEYKVVKDGKEWRGTVTYTNERELVAFHMMAQQARAQFANKLQI